MGVDSAEGELRVYRARGFYRALAVAPYLNLAIAVLIFLVAGVMSIALVIGVVANRATSAFILVLGLFVVVAVSAEQARVVWLMVREVERHPDGHLEVATFFGKRAELHEGDVVRIGPQLPYPWGRRVRTRDDGTFYFGGYERQGELMGALHKLRV